MVTFLGKLNSFNAILPRKALTHIQQDGKRLEERRYNPRMGSPLIQTAHLTTDDVLVINTFVRPNDRNMDEIEKLVTNFREMSLSGRNGLVVNKEDFNYSSLPWDEDDIVSLNIQFH